MVLTYCKPLSVPFSWMILSTTSSLQEENIRKASEVRAVFGSYEAAMEPVEAELLISRSAFLVDEDFGLTRKKSPMEVFQVSSDIWNWMMLGKMHIMVSRMYCLHLTLSDVVREFDYWTWLYGYAMLLGES